MTQQIHYGAGMGNVGLVAATLFLVPVLVAVTLVWLVRKRG
jgi:hypothetical protein